MSDADTAYQIAEQRIARAKETGARVLSLSPHYAEDGRFNYDNTPELSALDRFPPAIADLIDLQALYLWGTKVEDISHLAGMTAMQTLHLNGTKVEDISHLAGMIAMQTLYLGGTKVEDISHLAGMTAMQTLHLNGTKVDLVQLVAEGAAWADEDHALRDLEFSNTPAAMKGECLEGIYDANNGYAARTKAALAALRAERDRRTAAALVAPEPTEQRPDGPAFAINSTGQIGLIDPSLSQGDAEQEALRAELLEHLSALTAALSGSNEFASLRSRAERYHALLSLPPEQIGARAAWALANALRRALEAEEAAAASGRTSDQMPPIAASEIAGAVETGGLWLMGHQGVAEVERAAREYRFGPETPAELGAVEDLIDDLGETLDDETRTVLGDLLSTAKDGLAAGAQAAKVVLDAGWNLVSFITRTVWLVGEKTDKGITFVTKVGVASALLGKLILTHETAFRAYLLVEAPSAVKALDALVVGIKAAAKFFGV